MSAFYCAFCSSPNAWRRVDIALACCEPCYNDPRRRERELEQCRQRLSRELHERHSPLEAPLPVGNPDGGVNGAGEPEIATWPPPAKGTHESDVGYKWTPLDARYVGDHPGGFTESATAGKWSRS